MITDHNMEELLHYQPGHPVLSVYLNTDPVEGNADFYKLGLRSMLRDIALADDIEAIYRFIEHSYDWSGRSLAMFSCAGDDFFRGYSLAIPVRSRARVADRPHVKPLADLLDSYGGYGVVLVDKQGARYFHFHLGELQEQDGMVGESIRHRKRGGGSQAAGRRGGTAGQTDHVEEITERNMRDAADFAVRFFAEKNIRRILIGGTYDNAAMLRTMLPKAWQSLVVGTFPISMLASHSEVLQRAMSVGEEAEKLRQNQLAQKMITASAKGKGAITGLQETLNAVHEGRVQTLIIHEGFRKSGFRCKSCGYLSSKMLDGCPFCGGKVETIADIIDLAVGAVMRSGGEVEVLHPDQFSQEFEKIGAILRY